MIPWPAALIAHLAQPYQTIATCWKVTLASSTVLGFTDHDVDLVVSGVTYKAASGYTRSDIASADDLSVDNLEVQGILNAPAITEADLHAGIWDYAAYQIFIVNWANLGMGIGILRQGWLGEVSLGRNTFTAELRGLAQAYTRVIGQLTSPSCRNDLGDARCQVNLVPFTVTGTLTGVAGDNQTLYDTSRAEPGPTGGVAISAITRANPGVVTTATALGLNNGAAVSIYGATGMLQVNTTTLIRNPSGLTFQLPVDTSAFPAYTGGGTVVPLGSNTGYFDYGVITFTSGLNNGRSMEVRNYVPGQIYLQLPMTYACAPGDTYTMKAGCDKSQNTCKTRYSNVINMRAEPFLPGIDRLMQVGKQ